MLVNEGEKLESDVMCSQIVPVNRVARQRFAVTTSSNSRDGGRPFVKFNDARQHAEKLLEKITCAAEAGSWPQVKKLIRKYLRSPAVMYYAAFRVLGFHPKETAADQQRTTEQRKAWRKARQPSHDRTVERLVNRIDLFHRTRETVLWWREEKRRGTNDERRFRNLCKFGPRLQVQHLMIRDALVASFPRDESMYDLEARERDRCGRDKLTEDILAR